MKTIHCVDEIGEHFTLLQDANGGFICPVCGSPEFTEAPYFEDGSASFQMCSCCKFEFGFDDSPLASDETFEGIVANWDRWRLKFIDKCSRSKVEFEKLEKELDNLDIYLALDLIPVKRNTGV